MRRIILIFALTFATNVYADIAATTYVDSITNTRQATLTPGENITITDNTISATDTTYNIGTASTSGLTKLYVETGHTTDGTLTQNATTNALSNKQDILPMASRPTSGKYNVIWDADTGKITFEKKTRTTLKCDEGTYDIGFDQCVAGDTNGASGAFGYISHDSSDRDKDIDYNLTENGSWAAEFDYGVTKGIASCNAIGGVYCGVASADATFSQSDIGQYCWCKMTSPSASSWVFVRDYGNGENCLGGCAERCGNYVRRHSDFREAVYGAVDD